MSSLLDKNNDGFQLQITANSVTVSLHCGLITKNILNTVPASWTNLLYHEFPDFSDVPSPVISPSPLLVFPHLRLSGVCPNSSRPYLPLGAAAASLGGTSYLCSAATAGMKLSPPTSTTHLGEKSQHILFFSCSIRGKAIFKSVKTQWL